MYSMCHGLSNDVSDVFLWVIFALMHVYQSYFEKLLVTELCSGMSSNLFIIQLKVIIIFSCNFMMFLLSASVLCFSFALSGCGTDKDKVKDGVCNWWCSLNRSAYCEEEYIWDSETDCIFDEVQRKDTCQTPSKLFWFLNKFNSFESRESRNALI